MYQNQNYGWYSKTDNKKITYCSLHYTDKCWSGSASGITTSHSKHHNYCWFHKAFGGLRSRNRRNTHSIASNNRTYNNCESRNIRQMSTCVISIPLWEFFMYLYYRNLWSIKTHMCSEDGRVDIVYSPYPAELSPHCSLRPATAWQWQTRCPRQRSPPVSRSCSRRSQTERPSNAPTSAPTTSCLQSATRWQHYQLGKQFTGLDFKLLCAHSAFLKQHPKRKCMYTVQEEKNVDAGRCLTTTNM